MALSSIHNVTAEVNLSETATLSSPLQDLISDKVCSLIQAINFAIICELIDVLGTVANIINVVCFCKQGFKDSVNISLL
ncbi:unnamed protein product, partial [Candidula unifasciata]